MIGRRYLHIKGLTTFSILQEKDNPVGKKWANNMDSSPEGILKWPVNSISPLISEINLRHDTVSYYRLANV